MENTEVAARGDYSIAELRTMMTGEPTTKPAESESTEAVPVEGTAAAEPTETEPASGTDDKQERGSDGKFKSVKPAENETEEDDTPGVKKRIGKVLERQRQAEQRAADAERKLAELQGSRPAAETGKPAQPAEAKRGSDKPELKNFESYELFNEELVKWTIGQQEIEREQKKRVADQKASQQQVDKAHDERITAAKEKYTDWDEKINSLHVPISRELHNAIVESEHGPDVVYYCANHPEEAERIGKLSPGRQVVEFGKLEARFETAAPAPSGTTEKKKPLPKAAANVGGGSSSAGKEPNLSDPNLSMSAFKREVGRRLKRAA
jgi:hypothetical protein